MKKKSLKIIAVFLAINIFFNAVYPTAAWALTGGPTQPEVGGFTPVGTSEMVNAFTGDFNYNIPLMDVGGYPLNLSYQSGITMDQEASWVGLGWSLNPGVIDRGMRSLPDDFSGDEVTKEFNVKANNTFGVKFSPGIEVGGKGIPNKNLKYGLGLTYNNYTGFAFSASMDLKLSESAKTHSTVGLGLTAGSETGVGISPSLSFSKNTTDKQFRDQNVSATFGLAYNSRGGLSALTLSTSSTRDGKAYITKDVEVGMKRGMSGSDGASISFVSPTYMPPSGHSMINLNMSLTATLGAEVFPTHPNGKLEGFYAGQYLMNKTETFPAYGYLNSQHAIQEKVLLDFNREKDGSFNERTPSLPLTNFTYDTYSVSGQGIGGMYRAHRSDIGVLYDSKVVNISAGADFPGIEIGVANTAHTGINLSLNQSNSTGGKWEKNNDAAGLLAFKGGTGDPLYEASYFKKAGETNAESDKEFFDAMGGYEPVRISINHNLESAPTQTTYNESYANMNKNSRAARARRNEVISLLSSWEAKNYGYIKEIETYETNSFAVKGDGYKNIFEPQINIHRDEAFRKKHHTSQITTYRDDGAKYVYGIPAYNTKQDERTFAVQHNSDPYELKVDGTVSYTPGVDDTKSNNSGLDHYFDRTVMPAYAHSYLLTEILSADYVDVHDDGPTDDDLGTYTKINYSRTASGYKWRVPYGFKKASYNEGLSSVPGDVAGDDKGSYVYGEKELWYIHSIETKNYVAIFELGDRVDGLGVQDEQGGYNSAKSGKMKLLKRITLYSKQDLLKHKDIFKTDSDPTNNPTPLKTVNFEYDYSMCTGVDNNINTINGVQPGSSTIDPNGFLNYGGKLTLKKVYFTYGPSLKGKLSPYEFTYGSSAKYCLKGYDRWGNYKPNTLAEPAAEFPYTDQRPEEANYSAGMWHLNTIQLPSGGVITADLEADDYAYVQNKRAMQMFKVVGTSDGVPTSLPTEEDKNKLYKNLISRNYLIFEIPYSNLDLSDMGKLFFKEKDGTLIKDLYFRFRLDLGRLLNRGKFEYVSGYTIIAGAGNYGHFSQGGKEYGWVKIDDDREILDKIERPPAKVNAISQAGWCFTKMNLPVLAYNKPTIADGKLLQIVKSIASTLKGLTTVFNGFYNQMRLEGMSQVFDPTKSFIRLYNPVNAKKGGGCRVKKITLSDNWNALTSQESTEYGQEYDYTTKDEYGDKISSGVAAYEPLLGGDENPFRKPVTYKIKHYLAANDEFYQEEPFGESFFPGPTVGYSKVTVRNLQHVTVKRHATGCVVNEFYTAKDFPTIVKQTTIDAKRVKPNPVLKLLKIKARDFMTATQGFCIELNNMHGQPKGTYVYAEGKDKPISGVKYIYKTSVQSVSKPDYIDDPIKVGSLDNQMLAMERDGSIGSKMIGVDYDFVSDMREQETVTRTAGLGGNLEAFLILALPAVVPTVWPSYAQERTRFRSAVTTKIINRYGLLEQTIAMDQGSSISTKNKMVDAETGQVLLTETQNEYNDPLFSFSYPAHFAYDGMGPAYKNIDLRLEVDNITTPNKYFVPGDELEVYDASITMFPKVWIKSVTATNFVAIDENGAPVNLAGKTIKIIRSGRRNQSNITIGSFVSKKSPLVENSGKTQLSPDASIGIINAGAAEFSDEWGVFCECDIKEGQPYNPYVLGVRGNWRQVKSWVQLTGRTQAKMNNNTNVREDGIYTTFIPFWTRKANAVSTDSWQPPGINDVNKWKTVSEVTIYSPYGMELENKDALGTYSSAIYGYSNSLPTAVSANAKYKEIAFDGFEDYDFKACKNDHFSYKTIVTKTEDKKSHSGRNSIKVGANSQISIKKVLIKCE